MVNLNGQAFEVEKMVNHSPAGNAPNQLNDFTTESHPEIGFISSQWCRIQVSLGLGWPVLWGNREP